MKVRTDAAFRKILNQARDRPVVQVERTGSAQAHPSVQQLNRTLKDFGVNDIEMFHRNLAALWQRSYQNGWIQHERPVIDNMQTDTNLFFSSGAGPDAIRAMQHMKRIQNYLQRMKA